MEATIGIYLRGKAQEDETLCREYGMLYLRAAGDEFTVYRDPADRSVKEAKALDKLLRDAAAGRLRAVLCPELGALCRGAAEFVEYAEHFEALGVPLVFVRERIDLSTATGRTVRYAAGLFLHLEKQAASASIRDHMRALARSGHWLGGVTPTGYSSEPATPVEVDGKKQRTYRLIPVPEQVWTVRAIYDGFLQLDSLAKLGRKLEADGVRTKNGRAFSRFTLRQILENPVYMTADADAWGYFKKAGAQLYADKADFDGARGMMVYNKTVQSAGQAGRHRDISEWIVAVGAHEGLIPGAQWIKAQQRLAANKPDAPRKPKSDHGVLAGLLTCGYCGAHLRPKLTRREEADGELLFHYMCEHKEQTKLRECDLPNLNGNRADRAALALLRALDPDEAGVLPAPAAQSEAPGMAGHHERLSAKREQREALEAQISTLVFSLISAIDKAAYDYIIKEIDALHAQVAALDVEIEALAGLAGEHPLGEDPAQSAREMLARIGAADFDDADIAWRRAAVQGVVRAAEFDGEMILLTLAGGMVREIPLK